MLKQLLETIRRETQPIEGHTDPGALEDCWASVFEQLETEEKLKAELNKELKVSDELLKDRDSLLEEIPQCSAHGKCVPHAIEWIKEMKALSEVNT